MKDQYKVRITNYSGTASFIVVANSIEVAKIEAKKIASKIGFKSVSNHMEVIRIENPKQI